MNQLEITKHAKDYIDALANGIDPISGQELPNDTVLNQPRMIRCFFYVSDILRQVVENGGQVGGKKAGKKAPFALSAEQRKEIPFSETPLPISKFCDLLNGMVDLTVTKKLPATTVAGWMVEKGFLAVIEDPNGRHVKQPTPQGESIGLSLETRHGMNGPYTVILYDLAAQHFIVDNLDDILAFTKK